MPHSRPPEARASHNLPADPTPFIGREQELAELSALLDDPTTRLVTILGSGGMGKTRLALEMAAKRLPDFVDGVYFVQLAPLSAANNIVTTVAEAIGFEFYGSSDPERQLFDHLRSKSLLLVLDNFEHLLDGAPLVSNLLAYAPNVRVLVTSRSRLNLRGETVYAIGGMAFPGRQELPDLLEYDGVRLFIQTARRADPRYDLQTEDAKHVSLICRLVQGMPLGIELAAAWTAMLAPADIVAEIESSRDFLATDMQDMPEHLRSIRAVFERSWNLLSADERDIFEQLSVFRGGFTREAAQVVTGASLHDLTALVDKSLVRRPDPSGRYQIHELLRQYAAEKLEQTPEERMQVLDRHGAYFGDFLQQREDSVFRGDEQEREVLQDLENIRVAWRWAVTQERIADIDRMILGLQILHETQGTWSEGAAIFEWAADRLREDEPSGSKGIALGLIMALQSFFFRRIGRSEHGNSLALEAVSLLRQLNAREELAWAYSLLHSHGTPSGAEIIEDYAEMTGLLKVGLAIFEEVGHARGVTWTLLTLGNVARDHADYGQAIDYYERGLLGAQARQSHRGAAWALWGLATCAKSLGDYETARAYLAEVVNSAKETGSRLVFYLSLLGEVEYALADYQAAWRSFCRIVQIAAERPYLAPQSLTALLWMCRILIQRGEPVSAVKILSLVQTHPSSAQTSKAEAAAMLEVLRTELSTEAFVVAHERGKNLSLDSVIAQISRDYEASQALLAAQKASPLPGDLTSRELEILQLVADGRSNREIAAELVIALGTVKWYVSQIYSKLQVQSRTQAIHRARELELLP